jgi:hypothetical protein
MAYNERLTHKVTGNTAGVMADMVTGSIVFAGGNNITLSQDANTITISAGVGGAGDGGNILAAGTRTAGSNSSVLFSNANGVTFGLDAVNGSVMTASHNALTTAMASNRGSDFVQANAAFAGTNASGTIASNGISVSVGNYITTGALSNHSHGNPTLALTNLTGTTASASNGFTLSLSANAPAAGVGIAAGTRTATTAGNLLFETGNGITFGLNAVGGSVMTASHNAITTAMLSNAATISNINVSGGTTSSNLSAINFVNSNGVSWSLDTASKLYATVKTDYQTAGAYLTTARASNDAIGLNTALTANGVAWTVNSSGLSLNVPAFLTTAAQSNHSHGNPTLALTNLTGTTASASNGFTLSLSAAAPGAGAAVTVSASNGSFTVGNLNFSNANNVTFGTSAGSIVTASVAAPGGGAGYSILHYENIPHQTLALITNMTATGMTQRPFFVPFELGGAITQNQLMVELSRATSGSNAFTMQAGIYSYSNSTRIDLIGSLQNVFSHTATASVSGVRQFVLTGWNAGTTLSAGAYVLGLMASGTATISMNYSWRGNQTTPPPLGLVGGGTNNATAGASNIGLIPFQGRYSTTSGAMPASVPLTALQLWTTGVVPYFNLRST